ncbi:MAG: CPBP family intramembrane metalloprotease [Lachnospiraceae bacterium]|nr:CPBP family intramembrane metalloprotease [Lachnospiraceae bacterium]
MDFSKKKMEVFKMALFAILPIFIYNFICEIVKYGILFMSYFSLGVRYNDQASAWINDIGGEIIGEYIRQAMMQNTMKIMLVIHITVIPVMFALYRYDFKVRRQEGRLVKCIYRYKIPKYLIIPFFAVFTMYFGNVLINIVSMFVPQNFNDEFGEVSNVLNSGSVWVRVLATVVGAPIMEELLMRGLMYNRLKDYLGYIWAGLISSIAFGIIHMNLIQGLYAFIIGLALIYVYEKYKSIWAPIIMHAACNGASMLLTYISSQVVDRQEVRDVSAAELLPAMLVIAWICGLIVCFWGAVIYFCVKPVSYERIES